MTNVSNESDEDKTETSGGLDIVAGLVLVAICIFALTWLIPANTQPADSQFDVAPGFFPTLAVGATLILSIVLVIRRWSARHTIGGSKGILTELAIWTGASVTLMLVMPKISFLIMAPALLAGAMLFCGNRNRWLIAILAVVFPLVVYWAARLIFSVDLP
jgi:hypothetical protein